MKLADYLLECADPRTTPLVSKSREASFALIPGGSKVNIKGR